MQGMTVKEAAALMNVSERITIIAYRMPESLEL
jgi:hypothetical protein